MEITWNANVTGKTTTTKQKNHYGTSSKTFHFIEDFGVQGIKYLSRSPDLFLYSVPSIPYLHVSMKVYTSAWLLVDECVQSTTGQHDENEKNENGHYI